MTRLLVVEYGASAASELAGLGYDVVAAPSSEPISASMRSSAPDLMVLDTTRVAELEAVPARERIPVVYLAEAADVSTLQSAARGVARGYVVRPWTSAQLGATIEATLAWRAAASLREARVAALETELKTLSYSIAHDLRAPLRAVDGYSEMLVQDYAASLDAEAERLLQRVRRGCGTMTRILDGLLGLSRVTVVEPRHTKVDLSALARVAALELQVKHAQRMVDVVIASDLVVEGDESLLRTVLEVLIDNAWKFTAGVGSPRVEFGAIDRDGQRAYFVRDNGVGFDARYGKKLFEPFQRLHAADSFEGVGLGLATAKRAIDRHNGRLWAESDVGQGAAFFFAL